MIQKDATLQHLAEQKGNMEGRFGVGVYPSSNKQSGVCMCCMFACIYVSEIEAYRNLDALP